MTKTYATLVDFINVEITPALDNVEENFNMDRFIERLRDADLLIYDAGFHWNPNLAPEDVLEAFWGMVEAEDARAINEGATEGTGLKVTRFDSGEVFFENEAEDTFLGEVQYNTFIGAYVATRFDSGEEYTAPPMREAMDQAWG